MLRGLALFCAGLSLSVGLLCGGCCGLPMGLTYWLNIYNNVCMSLYLWILYIFVIMHGS